MDPTNLKFLAAICVGLACSPAVMADEAGGAAEQNPAFSAPHDPTDRWLDEVRAQRQAWEERRRAAKEAMDARRRWIDPWGAAQQEAREEENRRRREEFLEQIERDREAFRHRSPWRAGHGPEMPPPWNQPGQQPEDRQREAHPGQGTKNTPDPADTGENHAYPPLPGWDNRWYYRGY